MTEPLKERARALYTEIQDAMCAGLEAFEPSARFGRDAWEREAGGGGLTRVIAEGEVFEKGAVNVSAVWGEAPPQLREHLPGDTTEFFATGVSMIFHPRNPHAPTMHANLRYFEADGGVAWFGGGADMTPYYLYEDDARHFHATLKEACDAHGCADHGAWKAWCDRYFYMDHRQEARGVGGLFFDHLTEDLEGVLAFQRALGEALLRSYAPVVERRKDTPVTPEQEAWHLQRRGRYVEFNLVHDRGTRFGLQTGGRTESILVSLPPRVRWDYMAEPEEGTPERALLDMVRGTPRDWLS